MRLFGGCEQRIDHPLIPVKENKCCITFRNPDRGKVRVVTIDDCVIKDGIRCDYLLLNEAENEHYVELKGSDVRHAFDQIEETIKKLGERTYKRRAFIISTRVPAIGQDIQLKKKYFKKKYGAALEVKTLRYETDI